MSQETFAANESAIRAGVKSVMRNPKWRKSSRMFVLYESGGEILAEVFHTKYGPVVAHCSYGNPDSLGTFVVGAPRGRGKGRLVVAPLTDDPDQRFPIMARSFRYRLPVRDFRQWIAEGKTQHILPG